MRTRIGTRLILGAGLATALVIGGMSVTVLRSHTAQLLAERTRSADQLSETIKSATHFDMLENRRENLHRQIRGVGGLQDEGIRKVRVFNKEGRIMFSSASEEIGTSLDPRGEACYACHAEGRPLERLDIQARARTFRAADGTRVLGVINPIPNEASCSTAACHAHNAKQSLLGVLDVNVSLAEVDREIAHSRLVITASAVLAILAGSSMLWWLNRRLVVRPVAALVEGTRRVMEGDLGVTIPVSGRHELGVLARAFNEMTQTLADTQRQLTQADKLASVGRLAAGVAHEINNPLTGVLSYASLLRKRMEHDVPACEDLDVIVRETVRCRGIIRELLDFARPAAPARKPMDLNEVVRRSVSVVMTQLSLNQVNLSLDLTADLPQVQADPNQIQQVVVNLLLNAADAIGADGGQIRAITRSGASNAIEFLLEDSGRGISAEDLPRIFEPFFTTKGNHGTGLGLAVSWGIVEAHGGSLEVQSQPGQGTCFTLRLPTVIGTDGGTPNIPTLT
ncbi:MAG: HAMP domain-containing protein [Geothrix sp.]|uniref:sensor histidine kinase n=1 Tax=Geothrix sp. TaxID=1962974 RepID=UPI0017CFDCBE|nr:ATP-binding protein [Geothrix sp.]NWJ40148.1 HAMP domain-containing protein [Geothrix sp.]WIL21843.1 MAG: ATP-binding protein [Geothrix sp.]